MDNLKKMNKISSYQVILLIIIYRVIIAFSYLPIVNTPPGNQDIWIMLLLSIPYTLIIGFPMIYLSNKFNDLTIIEYSEKILGKYIGKIVGIYYTGFLLMSCVIIVATFVEILDTTMFIETPTWVTAIIMLLTCTYISYKGLEPIARGAEVFVPFILGVILLFIILGYNIYDFTVLLPVLKDSTFKELNVGAIDRSIKFSDIIILAMVTPHLERKEDIKNICKIHYIFINYNSIINNNYSSSFRYRICKAYNFFPFFTFNRLINLFDFIQRIDVLSVVGWIMGNIGKIAGYLYFTTVAFRQTINKQKNQPYIIPMAIIILITTVLIKNKRSLLSAGKLLEYVILVTSAITIFIIPLITVIVYFFRRKKL